VEWEKGNRVDAQRVHMPCPNLKCKPNSLLAADCESHNSKRDVRPGEGGLYERRELHPTQAGAPARKLDARGGNRGCVINRVQFHGDVKGIEGKHPATGCGAGGGGGRDRERKVLRRKKENYRCTDNANDCKYAVQPVGN